MRISTIALGDSSVHLPTATYSLDTKYHTIATIHRQDYAVGIIQKQNELIKRIQSYFHNQKKAHS